MACQSIPRVHESYKPIMSVYTRVSNEQTFAAHPPLETKRRVRSLHASLLHGLFKVFVGGAIHPLASQRPLVIACCPRLVCHLVPIHSSKDQSIVKVYDTKVQHHTRQIIADVSIPIQPKMWDHYMPYAR